MQAEFRRDIYHNYLILIPEQVNREFSYQRKMFLENEIPGFLSCRMNQIDQNCRFYYDITSRQSLSVLLETRSLDRSILENFIHSVLMALEGLQRYLLDAGGLCLQPEWIYGTPDAASFQFCFIPDGDNNWQEQLLSLAEYFLQHLKHEDREAVRLGYDFYQQCVEDRITTEELEQLLHDSIQKELPSTENSADKRKAAANPLPKQLEQQLPESREELLEAFFSSDELPEDSEDRKKRRSFHLNKSIAKEIKQEKEESGHNPEHRPEYSSEQKTAEDSAEEKVWLIIAPAVVGTAAFAILFYFGFLIPGAAAVGTGGLLSALLIFRYWRSRRERETIQTMEKYVKVQDWLEEEREEEFRESSLQSRKNGTEVQIRQGTVNIDQVEWGEAETCVLTEQAHEGMLPFGYLVSEDFNRGKTFPVVSEITMIGKSSRMNLVLQSKSVSRIHARVTCRNGTCILTDLNSRNGTRVNGTLLKPQEQRVLREGDRILFADVGYEWKTTMLEESAL